MVQKRKLNTLICDKMKYEKRCGKNDRCVSTSGISGALQGSRFAEEKRNRAGAINAEHTALGYKQPANRSGIHHVLNRKMSLR